MRERKAAGGLFNWEVACFFFLGFFVTPVSILLRRYRKMWFYYEFMLNALQKSTCIFSKRMVLL